MVFKCFIRFVLAQTAVTHGMELMTALVKVAQGIISTIMTASGLSALTDTTLPAEMVTIIEDVGFWESIPLWAITLLGSLFIWVLSLIMILLLSNRKVGSNICHVLRLPLFTAASKTACIKCIISEL